MPGRFAAALLCTLSAACATGAGGARILHVRDLPARPVYDPTWIQTERQAAAVAMAVIEQELGVPRLDVALHLLPDDDSFRLALVENGYDEDFAARTAGIVDAVAGHRRVYVKARAVAQVPGAALAAFFAHELTHAVQYELGGGRRGTSAQWLREGFADWVAGRVLASLGAASEAGFRQERVRRFRAARALVPPRLGQVATFPDWVAASTPANVDGLRAKAFLAADFLVGRRGAGAVLEYFALFADREEPEVNFSAAFGESLADFEAALDAHLNALR